MSHEFPLEPLERSIVKNRERNILGVGAIYCRATQPELGECYSARRYFSYASVCVN